ncbi:MAG: phosphoglucosamine mutase [Coriobacteriia bacterium]|nr:phosphoglucosamine mutase [Coriobacteriia bacterium]
MPAYFGTDGVRGKAFITLTVPMAETLGYAAVKILGPTLLIGRDTRYSGEALEEGLVRGINAAGGKALLAGIIPTPAIAFLVKEYSADGGVVISASHNPPEDNGIKFFNVNGYKLNDSQEEQFEQALQQMPSIDVSQFDDQTSDNIFSIDDPLDQTAGQQVLTDAAERYIEYAVSTFSRQGLDLRGIRIVIDCAHGAAFLTTPETFRRLGAELIVINNDYNGKDINVDCGSTHLEQLKQAVADAHADLGIAHDGDADRLLAIDSNGQEVDGDHIMAICAQDLQERGKLKNNTVVSTVISNLGFEYALESMKIALVRTDVGDTKVLSAMLEGDYVLGGEQSGHMVLLEYSTTGDGLISALQLLSVMQRKQKTLPQLAAIMQKVPQKMLNVTVQEKDTVMQSEQLSREKRTVEDLLGDKGRVLLRPSGTEPKIRVMVEADDEKLAETLVNQLAKRVAEIDAELT